MKRLLMFVMAAMVLFAPAAMAQKVNKSATLAKLDKSDAEIADAKKNTKAAVWVNRAKVYSDALFEPTKSLFLNCDLTMLRIALGEPTDTEDTTLIYPWVKVYTKDNKVIGWDQTEEIRGGLFEQIMQAYAKAAELDPKLTPKIKQSMDLLINYYSQLGTVSFQIKKFDVAADAYVKIATVQETPEYGTIDATNYYNAGLLSTMLGSTDPKRYVDGEKYLNRAIELGYTDESGDAYYYLFYCYYGQKDADKANLLKAKDALLNGIKKHPKNERIMEGLINLYTSEEGVGDSSELTDMLENMIKQNPNNADLWFGRGRIYYKLKNWDECIASFRKVAELKPDDFDANFYLGMFIVFKGDALNQEFNAHVQDYTSDAEVDAARAKIDNVYLQAIAPLEKAFEINPSNADNLEYLKMLCFRLRYYGGDENKEIMDKYNKYNALFKKAKGIE